MGTVCYFAMWSRVSYDLALFPHQGHIKVGVGVAAPSRAAVVKPAEVLAGKLGRALTQGPCAPVVVSIHVGSDASLGTCIVSGTFLPVCR